MEGRKLRSQLALPIASHVADSPHDSASVSSFVTWQHCTSQMRYTSGREKALSHVNL